MRKVLRAIAVFASVALIAACSSSSSVQAPAGAISVKLLPAYSDGVKQYSLQEATVTGPMVVTTESLGVQDHFTSARFASGGSTLQLTRLGSDVSFDIVLTEASGGEKTIHVNVLPPDFPAYTTTTMGTVAPGKIYAGVFSGLALSNPTFNMIFASDGTPMYFRRIDHPAINFHRVQYADGTVRYAYMDVKFPALPGKGSADGDIVVLDEGFNEIRRMHLLPFRQHGELFAENHDFILFDDDHWVLSAYDVRTVDLTAYGGRPDTKVSATIVQ